MNEQVSAFIEKKKAEDAELKAAARRKHLLELGLYDKTKATIFKEQPAKTDGLKYDYAMKVYFTGEIVPVEVSDEEYAEICKYAPENADSAPKTDTGKDERLLSSMSTWILVVGIILSAVLIIASIPFDWRDEFNPALLGGGIALLLMSITYYAALRVLRNISNTLKAINDKKQGK